MASRYLIEQIEEYRYRISKIMLNNNINNNNNRNICKVRAFKQHGLSLLLLRILFVVGLWQID